MTDFTDEQLIEAFNATGNLQYFDALAERHTAGIRATIYPMVLNHEDTDDLTQETLLKIVNALPRFRGQAKFTTWMYRIAIHVVFDFIRSNHRLPATCMAEEAIAQTADAAGSPSEMISVRERDRAIEEAIAALPPRLRAAITLVAIQGLSPGEAAKAAGCLKTTMYRRLHYARKTLDMKLKMSGIL